MKKSLVSRVYNPLFVVGKTGFIENFNISLRNIMNTFFNNYKHIFNINIKTFSTAKKRIDNMDNVKIRHYFLLSSCKHGFSLIEMLMALLVASLLMAAIAPVVTKKIEHINGMNGVDGSSSIPSSNPAIEPQVCAFGVRNNEDGSGDMEQTCSPNLGSLLSTTAYAIIVSGGGGGAAAVDGVESSSDITKSYTTAGTKTLTFNPSIKSMKIRLVGGGGSGGGGNGRTSETSYADYCRYYGVNEGLTDTSGHTATPTTPIAVYSSGANVCVTAYPQHPDFSADNYTTSGDDRIGPQDAGYVKDICHKYTSFKSANTISDPQDYYVCTYTAAETACDRLRTKTGKPWRIPTQTELSNFGYSFASATIPTGMQACNYNTGSYQCPNLNSGSNCYRPCFTWSSGSTTASSCYTSSGSTGGPHQYGRNLNATSGWDQGLYCAYKYTSDNIFYCSVRCVLPAQQTSTFIPYKGGGGGGGMYAEVDVPSSVFEYLAKNNKTGKLVLTVGTGGSSGTQGGNGNNGNVTSAAIYKESVTSSNLLWFVEVPGGNRGKAAATNENGEGGSQLSISSNTSPSCKYYLASSVTGGSAVGSTSNFTACNNIPGLTATAGYAGIDGGNGGNAYWNGSYGSSYGSGGNGGGCPSNATSASNCHGGSAGQGGAAQIMYKTRVPGIGGSGGGAGGYARVKFTYFSGNELKVVVGKGGAGGSSSGSPGSDGGNSLIKINGTTLYEVSGGKGGSSSTQGRLSEDGSGDNLVGNLTVPVSGNVGTGGELITGRTNLDEPSNKKGNDGVKAILPMIDSVTNNYSLYSNGGNGSINDVFKRSSNYTESLIPEGGEGGIRDGVAKPINSTHYPSLTTFNASDYHRQVNNFYTNYLVNRSYMYDAAGSGGGGGGWKYNSNGNNLVGSGANGQDGYVFIYFGIDDN